MIETQKSSVSDLERLDTAGAAREDTTVARLWLDDAWKHRSEQEYDKVHQVLDRIADQLNMIRQRIEATKLKQKAAAAEAALKKSRANVAKTKASIQQLTIEKKALEVNP